MTSSALIRRWSPHVTVAAIVEREGRFLMVEEHTAQGLRLNNPAGHLEIGESLIQACARETMEETGHVFTPSHLLGVYMSRSQNASAGEDITYLRFAFCGEVSSRLPDAVLDEGIVQAIWLTPEEILSRQADHRSPLVARCLQDFLNGQRFGLDTLHTDPTVWI